MSPVVQNRCFQGENPVSVGLLLGKKKIHKSFIDAKVVTVQQKTVGEDRYCAAA